MRILYLTARLPWPPHRGDRLTGWNLLRVMSQRHEVDLVSFTDGREPAGSMEELERLCRSVATVRLPRARSWLQAFASLPSATPSQVAFYRSRTMRRLVRRTLAERAPDVVFTQLFRMAPFVADLPHPNRVLFLADSLHLSLARSRPFAPAWKRPGVAWEGWRVGRYEVAMTARFREAWVVSEVDAADLRARGARNVAVVPHGVDERLFDAPRSPATPPRTVFLGNLSVPHNVDAAVFAAREVWPLVRQRRADAVLEIVGADPVPAVLRLDGLPGVEVVGPVADLVPTWSRARVMLAPLRFSAGIQNKVLEAMAAGVPVVATPGAADGIGAVHGRHLLVGADAASLADAVVATLTDEATARERARYAREHVRAGFGWQASVDRLERLVAGTAQTTSVLRIGADLR